MPICSEFSFPRNVPGQGPTSGAIYGIPQGEPIYSSTNNGVSHGDVYPQLPRSPHQLGIGHGVSLKHPPLPRSPHPTVHQVYSVQPAYEAHPHHLSNGLHQQNAVAVIATSSHYQGSAVQDASGRPYHQHW